MNHPPEQPPASPAEPRPAATVIVLRPQLATGFEVLLMQRNDTVAFMAGAHVFPGGCVDPGDRNPGMDSTPGGDPPRFRDLTPAQEWPFRRAAIRELREEAGLSLDAPALVPVGHWVTPEAEPRRYDTRFFIATSPEGQDTRHDGGETVAFDWLTPADALARCRAGEIQLPPPTWTMLRLLERWSSVDEAMAWARDLRIERVLPRILRTAGGTALILPGDPELPAPAGQASFTEARFVLTEQRGWQANISRG